MLIKDIFKVINTSEVSRVVIKPKCQPVLGVRPEIGKFVTISLSDYEKLAQVSDLEVYQLSVANNMLYIDV